MSVCLVCRNGGYLFSPFSKKVARLSSHCCDEDSALFVQRTSVAAPEDVTVSCQVEHKHAASLRIHGISPDSPLSFLAKRSQVDGGVSAATAEACVKAGANVLTSGSFIFGDHGDSSTATEGIAATAAAVAELRGALSSRWPQPAAG